MSSQPSQVSVLLGNLQKGDPKAASRLLPIVYDELRRLAAYYMRGEKPGQSIQATELVHEAYLRLVGQERIEWQGRSHFFAMAATAMRRILVDRARRKMAEKHGGGGQRIQLEEALVVSPEKSKEMIALDDALKRLEEILPRQCSLFLHSRGKRLHDGTRVDAAVGIGKEPSHLLLQRTQKVVFLLKPPAKDGLQVVGQ